jgi:TolA-binding protein
MITTHLKNPKTKRISFANKYTTIALACSLLLGGCLSTSEELNTPARATLADLAKQQTNVSLAAVELTQIERANKLAALYQSILSLEPDEEVRTQIAYRLVQINTEVVENELFKADNQNSNDQQLSVQLQQDEQKLAELIASYQALLSRYPQRPENEFIRYQLAKALALQGKTNQSLTQIETLLAQYPNTEYAAELHFRSGEIYYNQQDYLTALQSYKAVLLAPNNENYLLNSLYMQGWALFKLNRLPEADRQFVQVLDFILSEEKEQLHEDNFTFSQVNKHFQNIANDVQRVLSISLSQQQQAVSLLALVKQQKSLPTLYLYEHILFKNLADFLIKNQLQYDAELTYQSYISYRPTSLWAARFSIDLLNLYKKQGKHLAALALKQHYVKRYGVQSEFWQMASVANPRQRQLTQALSEEILPNLIHFSYEHSRRLYAKAQTLAVGANRVKAFDDVAQWLATYLQHAKLPQAQTIIANITQSEGLLADEFLYADALFEAKRYVEALARYENIAYQQVLSDHFLSGDTVLEGNVLLHSAKQPSALNQDSGSIKSAYSSTGISYPSTVEPSAEKIVHLKREAAYAATLTIRKILGEIPKDNLVKQQALLALKTELDHAFVEHYPNDERALDLATQAAQYAFSHKDYPRVDFYTDYVLNHYKINTLLADGHKEIVTLTTKAKKQVEVVSQIRANSFYQQQRYPQAEQAYQLALSFVEEKTKRWREMRELIAASIYLQAQQLAQAQPLLAVENYLRLGKAIPESTYRLNAEFDAANLLLAQKKWQQAITVLLAFQQHFPKHEYSASIPAKLAKAYEQLSQWKLAAEQLLIINKQQRDPELKREALYTAGEYFLKANDLSNAIATFRRYAHLYPQPFAIAQEVRFKMSEFYKQTKEDNKRYFWYRTLLKFHDLEAKNAPVAEQERSSYLASMAALELGSAHQATFNAIKLNVPLNKTLKRKQKAMKQAISYYQRVLTMGLAEFVPHATFNLAQMYRQLAYDVMHSQRPKGLDELALEEYVILLEEIAYPFEEKAIEIHESNAQRTWQDVYDPWVKQSFNALAELAPALYNKQEQPVNAVQWLH